MSDLPHITMTGGLIEVPELRFTPSGKAVASFRLAGKKRVQDATGKWMDGDPLYLSVTAWERLAENVAESLVRPGQRVIVTGRLEQQWWERDGSKQSKFAIIADSVGLDLQFSSYTERHDAPAGTGARPPQGDPWATALATDEPPF